MYYCGIDLGGSKSQVCVIDEDERNQINTKVPSDITSVLSVLKPFPREGVRIVAESTFNWDWLADGLQEAGYDLTLAHSLGMHAISYAKVKTDKRDARTLARLLRGNLIPESYICPPERRALRDLLRSRWRLVDHRAREYRSIRYMLYRQGRWDHTLAQVKALEAEDAAWISERPNLAAIGGHALQRIELLTRQITVLERDLKNGINDTFGVDYDNLRTYPASASSSH